MILVRHGLMIVGGPIGGKSSALKVLASSLGDLADNEQMEEFKVSTSGIKAPICSLITCGAYKCLFCSGIDVAGIRISNRKIITTH